MRQVTPPIFAWHIRIPTKDQEDYSVWPRQGLFSLSVHVARSCVEGEGGGGCQRSRGEIARKAHSGGRQPLGRYYVR